jgi:hypothetical protein
MIKGLGNKVRVELTFKEGSQLDKGLFLKGYDKQWSEDTLFVYVSQDGIVECIKDLFSDERAGAYIENVQMNQPTLEDVYIKLVGRKFK